jgi:hypothetical protein
LWNAVDEQGLELNERTASVAFKVSGFAALDSFDGSNILNGNRSQRRDEDKDTNIFFFSSLGAVIPLAAALLSKLHG